MKITRYPQSCLLIEKSGRRIVIDPGLPFSNKYDHGDLGTVAAVFYTHEHGDHCDPALIEKWADEGVAIYGPGDLAVDQDKVKALQPQDVIDIVGFRIRAVDLPHCSLRSTPVPYNLGYVVDETLLHPGDSSESSGIKVKYLAVPILGPDISPKDAIDQIFATGAEIVIPIHYDIWGANPDNFTNFCKFMGAPQVDVRPLAWGQSIELN